MLSLNNKIIFKKIENRKYLKNGLSLKKNYKNLNQLNTFYSPTNRRKNFLLRKNDKSTNTDRDNKIKNKIFSKENKANFFKLKTFDGIKFPNSENRSHKQIKFNVTNESPKEKNIIKEFNKNFFGKKILLDKKEDGKIYELKKNLMVRNFSFNKPKIFDFLSFNKNNNNNCLSPKKINSKSKRNLILSEKRKNFRRNGSFTPINRFKKIEDIYPTVFNIEGKINLNLLGQIQTESKRNKKKELINNFVRKSIYEIKKNMIKERNKRETKNYENNISDITYKRRLMMSKVELFKKDLNHLRRKISFKFNIQLPLYNLFLNLNY
jgi:hypothetical protein